MFIVKNCKTMFPTRFLQDPTTISVYALFLKTNLPIQTSCSATTSCSMEYRIQLNGPPPPPPPPTNQHKYLYLCDFVNCTHQNVYYNPSQWLILTSLLRLIICPSLMYSTMSTASLPSAGDSWTMRTTQSHTTIPTSGTWCKWSLSSSVAYLHRHFDTNELHKCEEIFSNDW